MILLLTICAIAFAAAAAIVVVAMRTTALSLRTAGLIVGILLAAAALWLALKLVTLRDQPVGPSRIIGAAAPGRWGRAARQVAHGESASGPSSQRSVNPRAGLAADTLPYALAAKCVTIGGPGL